MENSFILSQFVYELCEESYIKFSNKIKIEVDQKVLKRIKLVKKLLLGIREFNSTEIDSSEEEHSIYLEKIFEDLSELKEDIISTSEKDPYIDFLVQEVEKKVCVSVYLILLTRYRNYKKENNTKLVIDFVKKYKISSKYQKLILEPKEIVQKIKLFYFFRKVVEISMENIINVDQPKTIWYINYKNELMSKKRI